MNRWRERLWLVLRPYLTLEVLVRVAADVVIVNACYLAALVVRFLYRILHDPDASAAEQLTRSLSVYLWTAWLLTLISLASYVVAGFYTRTRFYRGRYKALAILQAVTAAYLVFGAALYALQAFSIGSEPPRLALALGWFFNVVATTAARLWSDLWKHVIETERPLASARAASSAGRRPRNVLVIGGAGYIGSVLCRDLLLRGYYVRVLDALLYGRESVEPLLGHPRFELIEADSRDVSAVCRAMLGMDTVVHLGEIVGDPACAVDEELTLQVNVAATRMIAEIAKGYGVNRFIYASSCSVYGASDQVLDERSGLNPISLYARAKIASERTLLGLNGSDFHPVILRFATVFGLSPRPRFDLVVNLLAARAVLEGKITVFGGEQWRPFVHVADVAEVIRRCIEAPLVNVKAQIFNVGSNGNNHTILEVGKIVHEVVPEAELVVQENDSDARNYRVSFMKLERELGFVARRSVREGVQEVVRALREGIIPDPGDKRYSNYKTFTDPSNHLSLRWLPGSTVRVL